MSRQQSGQSAVLMAFMILVLVAMVALSVDVGNAYGQQRRVQAMSNAGAMAGMASAMTNNTNNGVWTDVTRALSGNRTKLTADYTFRVDYVLEDGTVEMLGEWNGSTEYVPSGNSYPPSTLGRVQVTMNERVKTKFATVVGRPTLGVNGNAVACLGDYGYGVYPIAVPQAMRAPEYSGGKLVQQGVRLFAANGQEVTQNDPRWGKWNVDMQGMTIRVPVATGDNNFRDGGSAAFLNWGGETQVVDKTTYTVLPKQKSSALNASLVEPGTLQEGFMEAISVDSAKPNTKPMTTLQRGDWISGASNVTSDATSVQNYLNYLKDKQTKLMLPIYDAAGGSPFTAFHMVNMGYFQLRGVKLTGTSRTLDLMYLGNATASPTECASEMPDSVGNPKKFNIKGDVKLNNRVYKTGKQSGTTTYDIVIVMDTSGSMNFDWNDREPGQSGYSSANARVNDAKRVVRDFVQNYDITSSTGDPDARMAFVTFSGSYTEGTSNPAKIQSNYQTACAPLLILTDCGLKTAKWSDIQTKATNMTVTGGTPGPMGFELVETLLQNKRTPPAGKKYAQIVIFATDGVFNICGKDRGEKSCPYGYVVPGEGNLQQSFYTNNPAYNLVSGRPIWQAQQVANRIKNSGAKIFIVALTPTCLNGDTNCFDPAGLSDMSSGSKYYYQANDSSALRSIYDLIGETIVYDTCVPNEVTQQAAGVKVRLTKPDNPTWVMETTADSAGAFQFSNLASGQYIVKVDPAVVKSPEDGLTRTYSRTRNGRSLSEVGQSSVYINPQFPNGATVTTQMLLSLPLASDGSPNNACTMPAP